MEGTDEEGSSSLDLHSDVRDWKSDLALLALFTIEKPPVAYMASASRFEP